MSRRRRRRDQTFQRDVFTSPKRLSVGRSVRRQSRVEFRKKILSRTLALGRVESEFIPARRVVRDSEGLTRSFINSFEPAPVVAPRAFSFPVVLGADAHREPRQRPGECSRRVVRREVLHALRRVGRGHGGGARRPKSEVSC